MQMPRDLLRGVQWGAGVTAGIIACVILSCVLACFFAYALVVGASSVHTATPTPTVAQGTTGSGIGGPLAAPTPTATPVETVGELTGVTWAHLRADDPILTTFSGTGPSGEFVPLTVDARDISAWVAIGQCRSPTDASATMTLDIYHMDPTTGQIEEGPVRVTENCNGNWAYAYFEAHADGSDHQPVPGGLQYWIHLDTDDDASWTVAVVPVPLAWPQQY